nr:reverse transcriptase domain-containing protein [Tanacetum cinerariifolium]
MPRKSYEDHKNTRHYTLIISHEYRSPLKERLRNLESRYIHEGQVAFEDFVDIRYIRSLFSFLEFECLLEINDQICPRFILEFYSKYEINYSRKGQMLIAFVIQNKFFSYTLEEFSQILDITCEGACVFTDKWSLDELAYGFPMEGPYQTNPPSPDDIISYIRNDREGPCSRVSLLHALLYCKIQKFNLAYYMAKRIKWVLKQARLILPYGMLLTRLFKFVMSKSPELVNESYVLYDRVMNPHTAQQEERLKRIVAREEVVTPLLLPPPSINHPPLISTIEITQEVVNVADGGIFLYKTPNQAYQLLEDKVLSKLDWAKNQKTKSSFNKTVAFADKGSSNTDTNKIMARMDAMTLKMDAQYKELQSNAKKTKRDLDEDDIPMSREEQTKFMQTLLIRVKQKQLNLRVGTKRMIFNIHSAMKHSYSNDDTYFSIDVIGEILEEDFNTRLDEDSRILHSIEGTLLEKEIFAEFDEFMPMSADENSDSEFDTEAQPFKKITLNINYKSKHLSKNLLRILNLNPFMIIWNMYS